MIPQEKMANNHVYVFQKPKNATVSYVCEVRSAPPTGARPPIAMYLKMMRYFYLFIYFMFFFFS
jgi:hypothetical protein